MCKDLNVLDVVRIDSCSLSEALLYFFYSMGGGNPTFRPGHGVVFLCEQGGVTIKTVEGRTSK